MVQEIKAISLDGNPNNLTWDYIDSEAKKLGFNDRSKFTQYCYEKVIHDKKIEQKGLVQIILLCLMLMSFILLLAIFLGV